MSWISDVREEVKNLDLSPKTLRKFGLTVGGAFLLLMLWVIFKSRLILLRYIVGALGIVLITFGILLPIGLKACYKFWMGGALALGWIVSRVLLTAIFFLVITPIGLIARLTGKNFLDVKPDKDRETYWIKKDKDKKINYEKMY